MRILALRPIRSTELFQHHWIAKILEKVWNGKEVNLSFLEVFGYVSYIHIDSATRNKLDVKSKKRVFISYGVPSLVFVFGMTKVTRLSRAKTLSSMNVTCIKTC